MVPHRLSEEEIKTLAKQLVQEFFTLMTQEENVAKAAKAWGGELDKWIGKNVRRIVMLVIVSGSFFIAVKTKMWEIFLPTGGR